MKEHKVGAVISMCPEEVQAYKGIIAELIVANVNCFTAHASDNDSYDILPIIELCGPILSKSVDAKRKTFIHCWGGINRAPALVLGFMVLHKDYPIIDAFNRIVKARGEVLTNKYFRRQIVTAALGKQEKIQV
jgi:protein-tyrosine phosphatase